MKRQVFTGNLNSKQLGAGNSYDGRIPFGCVRLVLRGQCGRERTSKPFFFSRNS